VNERSNATCSSDQKQSAETCVSPRGKVRRSFYGNVSPTLADEIIFQIHNNNQHTECNYFVETAYFLQCCSEGIFGGTHFYTPYHGRSVYRYFAIEKKNLRTQNLDSPIVSLNSSVSWPWSSLTNIYLSPLLTFNFAWRAIRSQRLSVWARVFLCIEASMRWFRLLQKIQKKESLFVDKPCVRLNLEQ